MEILVDREIVGAERAFGDFGVLRSFDGRDLRAGDIGAAEVLLAAADVAGARDVRQAERANAGAAVGIRLSSGSTFSANRRKLPSATS